MSSADAVPSTTRPVFPSQVSPPEFALSANAPHAILGVEVVAEGVETAAELAALRALGCERIQGFLFARPLDPDAAARFVAAR